MVKVKVKGYDDLVTLVGNLLDVVVGSVLLVEGQWKVDKKYGQQFLAAEPDTFAGAALVTVGLGRINMTVAKFNSRFYSRSNIRIGNEPCPKSQFGNPDAIGKRVCLMVLFH